MIQGVEEFTANFKVPALCDRKVANHSQIHGLQSRSVQRIASDIAERISSGHSESGGIKPLLS